MAKLHSCKKELVSEAACGLIPALKLRWRMNTDRERATEEDGGKRKTNVRLVLSQNLKPALRTQTGTFQKN